MSRSTQTIEERDLRSRRWFAVVVVTVGAVAFGMITIGGIGENLVYYWSPSELIEAGDGAYGAQIRLGGRVAEGSISYTDTGSLLEFEVGDREDTIRVLSQGVPPQMFREGIGVVVEGRMNPAGYFESDRLMVSHDNEYEAPVPGDSYDAKELMESTMGLDVSGSGS